MAKHRINIFKNFVVPKAQHPITVGPQKIRASSVSVILTGMLPTIQLHDQALFETAEVRNERTDNELAAKFKPAELS